MFAGVEISIITNSLFDALGWWQISELLLWFLGEGMGPLVAVIAHDGINVIL